MREVENTVKPAGLLRVRMALGEQKQRYREHDPDHECMNPHSLSCFPYINQMRSVSSHIHFRVIMDVPARTVRTCTFA